MRDEFVHTIILAEQMKHDPFRLACEARYVAAMDWKRRSSYLQGVAKARGKEAAEALRVAVAK